MHFDVINMSISSSHRSIPFNRLDTKPFDLIQTSKSYKLPQKKQKAKEPQSPLYHHHHLLLLSVLLFPQQSHVEGHIQIHGMSSTHLWDLGVFVPQVFARLFEEVSVGHVGVLA